MSIKSISKVLILDFPEWPASDGDCNAGIGLDSSTTFLIIKCIQNFVHLQEATVLISLLQPAPETFDLFDDVILLSEGRHATSRFFLLIIVVTLDVGMIM